MKYLLLLIPIIGIIAYYEMKPKDKAQINDVIKYKNRVVLVKDTITNIEIRLQKAKEIHDTVTIVKEQDTLIKFLTIETKLQDTIIKKQDTIIVNCDEMLKKEKRKKWYYIIGGSALLVGSLLLHH
jgi:hypothetical protein